MLAKPILIVPKNLHTGIDFRHDGELCVVDVFAIKSRYCCCEICYSRPSVRQEFLR